MEQKKLRRSADKYVAGVCAGLAEYFGVDATLMRVIFALATIFFPGSGILAYIILWLVVPEGESATGTPTS